MMEPTFRGGVASPNRTNKTCTLSFIKTRAAARTTAMQARGMDVVSPSSSDNAATWTTMSGYSPKKSVTSQRLTSVHIGSSRLDCTVSYPDYPSSPNGSALTSTGGDVGPCYSPIRTNQPVITKRDLEMFGNRPVSPQRTRDRMTEYQPMSRLSSDGSFGNSTSERVYREWSQTKRGRNRATGEEDGGAVASSGVRGRMPSVGLNSGRIDTIVGGCY